jgi:hypothetical protein
MDGCFNNHFYGETLMTNTNHSSESYSGIAYDRSYKTIYYSKSGFTIDRHIGLLNSVKGWNCDELYGQILLEFGGIFGVPKARGPKQKFLLDLKTEPVTKFRDYMLDRGIIASSITEAIAEFKKCKRHQFIFEVFPSADSEYEKSYDAYIGSTVFDNMDNVVPDRSFFLHTHFE